jgi:hypothetical protein
MVDENTAADAPSSENNGEDVPDPMSRRMHYDPPSAVVGTGDGDTGIVPPPPNKPAPSEGGLRRLVDELFPEDGAAPAHARPLADRIREFLVKLTGG